MNVPARTKKGFTMIETLIAIAVLMIGAVGPLTLVQRGVSSATYAREKTIALFLAEDALEYLKNVRDSDIVSTQGGTVEGTNYFFGYVAVVCLETNCTVETTLNNLPNDVNNPSNSTVKACSGTCSPINFSPSVNAYSHQTGSDWDESIYTRQFTVTTLIGGEVRARVVVSWKGNTVYLQRNFNPLAGNEL